jgi:hypothetical protein
MIKEFSNGIQLELSGSLIQIKENGMTLKAYEVNPTFAVDKFNELAEKIQNLKQSKIS